MAQIITDLFLLWSGRFTDKHVQPLAGQDSKNFRIQLNQETLQVLQTLNSLLPSNYIATVPGSTNYALFQKTQSQELARILLQLNQINNDNYFSTVRPEFLYQNLTSMENITNSVSFTNFTDVQYRTFATQLLSTLLQGGTPANILTGLENFVGQGNVTIIENFLEARMPDSGLDISDEFGFVVDIVVGENLNQSLTTILQEVLALVNIIKPAHTYFVLDLVFEDDVDFVNTGQDSLIAETYFDYFYDDIRKFCGGISGQQRLGQKTFHSVSNEESIL